jgi:hypothetical protein
LLSIAFTFVVVVVVVVVFVLITPLLLTVLASRGTDAVSPTCSHTNAHRPHALNAIKARCSAVSQMEWAFLRATGCYVYHLARFVLLLLFLPLSSTSGSQPRRLLLHSLPGRGSFSLSG